MNAEAVAAPSRQREMVIKPIKLDPVYNDPDIILNWAKRTAPHQNVFEAEGFDQGDATPFFRAYVCPTPGEVASEELLPILHNPNFIEAAKEAYNVEVVRPTSLVLNFNVPGPAMPGHMDFPRFRGLPGQPQWQATVMGLSQLFLDWDVQIASGLCWFYGGEGGEFRYWPNGTDKPAQIESGPFWNRGLISDNEYTFHQACSVGPREKYLSPKEADKACSIHWIDDEWKVINDKDGKVVASYPFEEVRILTLWKAYVFKDEAEAAIFDQHSDDLDIDKVTQIFADDMRAKGIEFNYPEDPLNDLEWRSLLFKTYQPAEIPEDIEPVVAAGGLY